MVHRAICPFDVEKHSAVDRPDAILRSLQYTTLSLLVHMVASSSDSSIVYGSSPLLSKSHYILPSTGRDLGHTAGQSLRSKRVGRPPRRSRFQYRAVFYTTDVDPVVQDLFIASKSRGGTCGPSIPRAC